jgi:hypothetical protein
MNAANIVHPDFSDLFPYVRKCTERREQMRDNDCWFDTPD